MLFKLPEGINITSNHRIVTTYILYRDDTVDAHVGYISYDSRITSTELNDSYLVRRIHQSSSAVEHLVELETNGKHWFINRTQYRAQSYSIMPKEWLLRLLSREVN